MTKIGIVGAGLVGSMMANFLARRGFEVSIFEKRPHPKEQANYSGRSINLALSERGLKSLRALGLERKVKTHCMPMYGRSLHQGEDKLTFQPYGAPEQHINAVSRRLLNLTLIEELPSTIPINFDHSLLSWDFEEAWFESPEGKVSFTFDYLIGADGAFSKTRNHLPECEASFEKLSHRYQEYHFPPIKDDWAFGKDALHIWPRKEFMLIALPNPDKSFTGTLFLAGEGEKSFSTMHTVSAMRNFFAEEFPDALDKLPDFDEQFAANPISELMTIRVNEWNFGNTLIIGDAAHAIVPFYGQGMNAGFEDCLILDALLDQHDNISLAFEAFARKRKADANAIADMALGNFIEMRDKVIDEDFVLQKKIEAFLHESQPDHWVPQYTMVTFGTRPYNEVQQQAKLQNALMKEILEIEGVRADWSSTKSKEAIIHFLVERAIFPPR